MIGSGQNLVIGDVPLSLEVTISKEDVRRVDVGYASAGGTAIVTPSLTGGQLGAVLAFQRDELDGALTSLGRIATVLAYQFNEQHRLGQDLSGQAGGVFFSITPPEVISAGSNTGTATVTADVVDATALLASDYRVGYDTAAATPSRGCRTSTSSTYASLPQTIDGVRVTPRLGHAGQRRQLPPPADAVARARTHRLSRWSTARRSRPRRRCAPRPGSTTAGKPSSTAASSTGRRPPTPICCSP
jgi:flagellar hook-associated protein 1 FlgK